MAEHGLKRHFTDRGVEMRGVDVGIKMGSEAARMPKDEKSYPTLHLGKHIPGLDKLAIGDDAVIVAKVNLVGVRKDKHGEGMDLEVREVEDVNPGKYGKSPGRKRLRAALREVFSDEPSTVTRAKVSKERKRKMKVAIAFAKARKA